MTVEKLETKFVYRLQSKNNGKYLSGRQWDSRCQSFIPALAVNGQLGKSWTSILRLRRTLAWWEMPSGFYNNFDIIETKLETKVSKGTNIFTNLQEIKQDIIFIKNVEKIDRRLGSFVSDKIGSINFDDFQYLIRLRDNIKAKYNHNTVDRFHSIKSHLIQIGTKKTSFRYQYDCAVFKYENDILSLKLTFGEKIQILYDYKNKITLMK